MVKLQSHSYSSTSPGWSENKTGVSLVKLVLYKPVTFKPHYCKHMVSLDLWTITDSYKPGHGIRVEDCVIYEVVS
jgi:hypothetical protein